jgi:hypothetical protein
MIYDGNVDRYRIAERAEQGVDERVYAAEAGGLSDYQLAEEVIKNASNKLGMDPDDLQAYLWFAEKDLWLKNGWSSGTAAKKSDFREEADKNDISRYYLGLSTERDQYTDPVLEAQENIEILNQEKESITNDLREGDLISLKVNTTQGQYLIYPERSFDAEMIVTAGQDMTPVLRRAIESAKKHEQESVFLSEVLPIDERMDPETMERELAKKPNARPAVELQFRTPMSFEAASEFAQQNLDKEGVQIGPVKTDISGYTFITNENGTEVLGVKYQFVPEFVFENEEDITDENLHQAVADWVLNAQETKLNLENNENVLYFYKHYVDTFVAHNNQYNEILNKIKNGSEDIYKGTSKTRTKQYYQSKGRSSIESETSSGIDAQRNQDGGDRPRFSGTVPSDDGGSISQTEHRRLDTQKLPSALSGLLGKLKDKGFTSAELIYGIKSYSLKVNGKELTTEQARVVLSKYMSDNGFRQRGFETGSVEKAKDQDVGKEEVYDWVNNNPNYYKTMDMKETMDLVVEDINNRGGFENEQVIKDLLGRNTTIEELARVQLARQAALHHNGLKVSKLRSEGASGTEIDSVIDTMGQIERVLAHDATRSGQASAALRSWTARSVLSINEAAVCAVQDLSAADACPDLVASCAKTRSI